MAYSAKWMALFCLSFNSLYQSGRGGGDSGIKRGALSPGRQQPGQLVGRAAACNCCVVVESRECCWCCLLGT